MSTITNEFGKISARVEHDVAIQVNFQSHINCFCLFLFRLKVFIKVFAHPSNDPYAPNLLRTSSGLV